jgi:pimeloyl-ACP methyl ester carboxylesterase
VTTEDGYILNLFRVKDPRTQEGAPVVFLQHGLLASAENFVSNGEESPAFMLARRGYDVWCGNHRGTKYARDHETLNPDKDEEYWQFSFPEMGDFDLPTSIDYVRSFTKQQKVAYLGHSQGTS